VAENTWPDAAIAIAGIAFVFGLVMLAFWQIAATWRARMTVAREEAYRRLAEEATQAQRRTADSLAQAVEELARIGQSTADMQRLLREVE
jgi:Na+/phosphate symporter